MNGTVLEAIIGSLEAAGKYNPGAEVKPAAILWTDKERQWAPLLDRLREMLPQLLALGDYDPATRTGPAIWLKCMMARTLPEADWPETTIPILYLGGVGRQDLRAIEECPKRLQPLAELQYRGVYWTQLNGRDWTLLAFLQSQDGGLNLDVARDAATVEALERVLVRVADATIEEMLGRRWEANDFDALLMPDPVRDLLAWIDNPTGSRQRWSAGEWEAFRNVCRQEYGFDPQADGEITAAERLGGAGKGAWRKVWERFAEAPRRYPHLPDVLRRAAPAPTPGLFMTREPNPAWPQDNDEQEKSLREGLAGLDGRTRDDAAKQIARLEADHSARRNWVWKELGQAPLAVALGHLAVLAEATATVLGGATPQGMAENYVREGWRADAAVLDALAAIRTDEDFRAVCSAVRALYQPWLGGAAQRFQDLVAKQPLPPGGGGVTDDEAGTVILFADGLRFDMGRRLDERLKGKGLESAERWHWVALPSVTPTAKPAISLIADLLGAGPTGEDFRPVVTASGKPLTTDRFRQLMGECGYQILRGSETGDPAGKGWTEVGDLDEYGHAQGWKLARRVEEVLGDLTERIEALLGAGWKRVRVVTDHGWLLMPGNLPKSEMPAYLTDTRWGRCAALKSTSTVDGPVVAWRWGPEVSIACAPGISVFKQGLEYAHGGLSVQECVAIELTVGSAAGAVPAATIAEVNWVGMRCRVKVSGSAAGLSVDIRTKAADTGTSVVGAKAVGPDGLASLLVEDDRLEGSAVIIVLLVADGRVIAKQSTMVGG
jgi:hypothetical protein